MKHAHNATGAASTSATLLVGGRLAIDFANLRFPDGTNIAPHATYLAFVDFLAASAVVHASSRPALLRLWETAPEEAEGLLGNAAELQNALRILFGARIDGAEIVPRQVEPINEILAHTEGYDHLEPLAEHTAGRPDWRLALHARAQGLPWLLTAIARSAAGLIAEGPRAPIRKCANPGCGLFFYDDSRTGRRRWCSMAVCGNRAKVAAHYRREKNKS
ncbi:MAG: CGNR zinc finger domain-containing protein [Candidatus Acidiferrales bacterium]